MYSDFCKIVRGGTISRILYRLTVPSMRKWPPKSISFILSQTKGLWSANSHLLSRGRSSTRDHKDSKQFSKTRTFLVNVCFSGKKGKLLGKINSFIRHCNKDTWGERQAVASRTGRKFPVFVEASDAAWMPCKKKKNHEMRKERKTAEIKEKIKKIENNWNHLQTKMEYSFGEGYGGVL